MKESKLINFKPRALKKQVLNNLVEVQTQRLIGYAEKTIKAIGDKIQTYNSRNHMDRTGNLLNSLCWGVAYSGQLKASGFYRDEIIHSGKGILHNGESFLHEYFIGNDPYAFPVHGRQLAQQYISQYGKMSWNGRWRVWFAILAPYWGFWEEGFKPPKGGFLKFQVMTEFYDKISKDLKPASVKLEITKAHHYSAEKRDNNKRLSGGKGRKVQSL
jgi:hypothetical protein